ncbi:MAG: 6-pyruvoyl-tetrahydropterin synthase-related protein [Chthoniobacterales bacterium]
MTEFASPATTLVTEERHHIKPRRRAALLDESKQLTLLHWLILLTLAVLMTRVMWAPGLLWGHSAWYDLTRMVEFNAALRAGDYFPTWSRDLYYGHGSPLFQFYAPLVYYFTEVPVLAGFDIVTALKLTLLLTLIASGIAMYYFAAANVSRWAACVAALLYMVAPYRMVDLFVRHALAEHAAFVWLPLLALGTQRFVAQRTRSGAIAAIIASAGLVLTHNITAMIALPVCIATGWFFSGRTKDCRAMLFAGVPTAIGVGLAAFFWLPALAGRAFTKAEESLTGGYFDYHQHFVSASEFLRSGWGFGERGTADQMPLQIGLPHLLVVVTAVVLLIAGRRTRCSLVGVVIVCGAVFMSHASATTVWHALPLIKYVQFPWRFLGLLVFGAALCGAAVFDQVTQRVARWEVPGFVFVLATVMAAYLPYYTEAQFVAADRGSRSISRVTADQAEGIQAHGRMIPFDQMITPAAIRTARERATSSDDFLPRGVQQAPTAPALELVSAATGTVTRCDVVAPNHYRASVSMRESGKVALQQFWFPGWDTHVDSESVKPGPTGDAAVVACDVAAGDHIVEFNYTAMPLRRIGWVISGLSGLTAALLLSLGKSAPKEVAP